MTLINFILILILIELLLMVAVLVHITNYELKFSRDGFKRLLLLTIVLQLVIYSLILISNW